MHDVRIEPKEEGKGRTFRATCFGIVQADPLWEGGSTTTDDVRPVWAMFVGTEQELRSFMANLSLGRKILTGDGSGYVSRRNSVNGRMEFLKSAGYHTVYQREPEGVIATVYLSSLFRLDPGMVDPSGAKFILLPPSDWGSKQKIHADPIVDHILRIDDYKDMDAETLLPLVPLSFLFSTFLDRRTRCPLVSDGRFYLQILLASLRKGMASWSKKDAYQRDSTFGYHNHFGFVANIEDTGLDPGLAFWASHEDIGTMLAEEVKTFFSVTGGK